MDSLTIAELYDLINKATSVDITLADGSTVKFNDVENKINEKLNAIALDPFSSDPIEEQFKNQTGIDFDSNRFEYNKAANTIEYKVGSKQPTPVPPAPIDIDTLSIAELYDLVSKATSEDITLSDGTVVKLKDVEDKLNDKLSTVILDPNASASLEEQFKNQTGIDFDGNRFEYDTAGMMTIVKYKSNTKQQTPVPPTPTPTPVPPKPTPIDLDKMSLDDLLNLYAKNEAEIRRINEVSSMSGVPADAETIRKLSEMQQKIEQIITERLNLMENLKDLTEDELNNLKKDTQDKLSELWKVVTASGSQASAEELAAKDKLEKQIKAIDGEFTLRNKQEELRQEMKDILGEKDTKDIEKKNPNDIQYQLDAASIDDFNTSKDKFDLLDKISKNRQKNKTEEKNEEKQNENTVTVTFLNRGFAIPNYSNLSVPLGTTIHGPVIEPVPLNKKGQPKKITASVFDGWMDQYGNDVDLSQPLDSLGSNIILSAKYKFDLKKAAMVGLGAAVGGVALAVDLAVPLPIPSVSAIGATGFGIASGIHGKNLKNVQAQVQSDAASITAFDDIPPELQAQVDKAKSRKYLQTFLASARTACIIAGMVKGFKVAYDKLNTPVNTTPTPDPTPDPTQGTTPPPDLPTPDPIPEPEATIDIFGGYEPTGQVYRTAKDALVNSNGLNPYTPAFKGNETFEVLYNGMRFPIEKGQSIESILQSIGATDPSQVAVNVMNADGVPLTWQSLADLTVQGVEKGSTMVH